MAFDQSNDYTEFSNLDSGQNGTLQGLIEIDGSGTGFRYKKTIIANLPFETKTIRDDWLVEILEHEREGARVLFRQRVNFGIHVVATPGPIPIFIAYPADNEQIETTIINGQEIDPATAKDHLDLGYKSEFGITTEFVANPGSQGGGEVRGDWESLPYRQEISEGNIFVIRRDGWRPIGLSKIATYQTSYLPGASGEAWLTDTRTGARWFLFLKSANGKKNVKVIRSRQQRSTLSDVQWQFGLGVSIGNEPGVVEEGSQLSGMILFRFDGGALVVMGAIRSTPTYLRAFVSTDEGKSWRRIMNTPLEISPLAMCAVRNGARVMVYGVDASRKPAYAVLAYGQVEGEGGAKTNGWKIVARGTPSGSNLFPVKGTVQLEPGDGGAVRLLWRDDTSKLLHVLVTVDDGKTYKTETLS